MAFGAQCQGTLSFSVIRVAFRCHPRGGKLSRGWKEASENDAVDVAWSFCLCTLLCHQGPRSTDRINPMDLGNRKVEWRAPAKSHGEGWLNNIESIC